MGRGMRIVSYLRGKVFVIDQPAYYAGINLAYAGKRAREGNKMKQIMDHPRIRGEKSALLDAEPEALGSPPPMRGKVPP